MIFVYMINKKESVARARLIDRENKKKPDKKEND